MTELSRPTTGAPDNTVPADTTAVIVCTYDHARWDDLCDAITSVGTQHRVADELVIVVDHNDSLLARSRAEFPHARVVPNFQRRGLAGARNSGIVVADSGLLAFLDDDAVAEPDWLATLIAPFADPGVVAVGGRAMPRWPGRRPHWWPEEFDWVVGCTYRGMPETRADVRNVIGCNMAFRSVVFDAVGTFTEGLGREGTRPVGCEETELCIRIAQRWPAARIVYEPAAVVRHRVPPGRASWKYFRQRCVAEGMSKAQVAGAVGARDALATERTYVTRALPRAVVAGIAAGARGEPGLGKAGSVVGGLAATGFGYLRGSLSRAGARAGRGGP